MKRRDFVRHCSVAVASAGVAGAALTRTASARTESSAAAGASVLGSAADPIVTEQTTAVEPLRVDDSWLEGIAGRHAHIFEVGRHLDGGALLPVHNFIDAMVGPHGVPAHDVVALLGLRSTAISYALNDALWAKYKLGEWFEVTDPATRAPALRNLWFDEPDLAAPAARLRIAPLQRRGMVVLVCDNNLRGYASAMARDSGVPATTVRQELLEGLVPGAIAVPAMVAAVHRAQRAGASFSSVG